MRYSHMLTLPRAGRGQPERVATGVFLVAVALAACYRGPKPAMGGSTTTNSTVPCLEACQSDDWCRSHCLPVGNQPPPPGIMYQR